MNSKDPMGDRMKKYESIYKQAIIPRTATILRLDGKAFHTFTKKAGFKFPFCSIFHDLMSKTALKLFNEVQNCKLAYFQSDEISLLLTDWATHETQQWYGGVVQKMVSVSAAIATAEFNVHYEGDHTALFDSRVFQVPLEEVNNVFLWRQKDATRNSISMLGQSQFSHKELHRKSSNQVQEMLLTQKDINWNDLSTWKRRGSCVKNGELDLEIPIFSQDKQYIEELLK